MPDGFEPHTELARIYTLRDLMVSCRERMPTVLNVLDEALADPDISIRLQAADMCMNRGFGKPRQHVEIGVNESGPVKRVIALPDNGRRDSLPGPIIDAAV